MRETEEVTRLVRQDGAQIERAARRRLGRGDLVVVRVDLDLGVEESTPDSSPYVTVVRARVFVGSS